MRYTLLKQNVLQLDFPLCGIAATLTWSILPSKLITLESNDLGFTETLIFIRNCHMLVKSRFLLKKIVKTPQLTKLQLVKSLFLQKMAENSLKGPKLAQ